ncbi:hypothetical protein V8E53_006277 [Lactarius tabidus]
MTPKVHHTMNHLNSAPTNLSAFSLWPDALVESEEEIVAWAQPAEYTEPGVATEGIPLDILDAVLAWGQSGTSRIEAPASQIDFSTNWMSEGLVAEGSSSHAGPLVDAIALATTAPPPPTFASNTDPYTEDFFFPQSDFPISRTPSLTNGSSLPSPQNDGPLNGFLGLPHPEAAPSFIQQPGPSIPQFDIFGVFGPNPITCAPPTWSMEGINSVSQVKSKFSADFSLMLDMTYPATWGLTQLPDHLAAPTGTLATMATSEAGLSTSLGKRSRQRYAITIIYSVS